MNKEMNEKIIEQLKDNLIVYISQMDYYRNILSRKNLDSIDFISATNQYSLFESKMFDIVKMIDYLKTLE